MTIENKKYYPEINSSISLPEIEEKILNKWKKERLIFNISKNNISV